jgi:hypothetical protein
VPQPSTLPRAHNLSHIKNYTTFNEGNNQECEAILGRAIAQAVSRQASHPLWPEFEPRAGHVGFVVDKTALEQVFFEYSDFSCQFSFN